MPRVVALAVTADGVTPAQLASQSGDCWCEISPGERRHIKSYSRLNAPHLPCEKRQSLFAALCYDVAPERLFAMRNACFYGAFGFFAGATGEIIQESIEHWSKESTDDDALIASLRREVPAPLKNYVASGRLLPPARRLSGTYALALSRYTGNYYHWHVDILPTLLLLRQHFPDLPHKVLIGHESRFARSSLSYLGYEADQIVALPPDEAVSVERLVFASTVGNHGMRLSRSSGEVFHAIRQSALRGQSVQSGRKLLVSRGNSRRRLLVNRSEVEKRFVRDGFEVVDPGTLSYDRQIRLFAEAEVVVGEHGAGLANIGFCEPGTLVVELFHPVHNVLCYLGLAETRGLLHQIFVGTEINDADGQKEARWVVDAEAAAASVQQIVAERAWYLQGMPEAAGSRSGCSAPTGSFGLPGQDPVCGPMETTSLKASRDRARRTRTKLVEPSHR